MLTDKIIFPEKQKKRCVDEILSVVGETVTGKERKAAIKEKLIPFYDALVKLPFPFQIDPAAGWIELMKVENESIDDKALFTGRKEKKAFKYICDISGFEPDFEKEKEEITQKTSAVKEEIKKLLEGLDDDDLERLTEKTGGLEMIRIGSYLKEE